MYTASWKRSTRLIRCGHSGESSDVGARKVPRSLACPSLVVGNRSCPKIQVEEPGAESGAERKSHHVDHLAVFCGHPLGRSRGINVPLILNVVFATYAASQIFSAFAAFRLSYRSVPNARPSSRSLVTFKFVDFGFSTRVCEHDSSADDTIRVMSR